MSLHTKCNCQRILSLKMYCIKSLADFLPEVISSTMAKLELAKNFKFIWNGNLPRYVFFQGAHLIFFLIYKYDTQFFGYFWALSPTFWQLLSIVHSEPLWAWPKFAWERPMNCSSSSTAEISINNAHNQSHFKKDLQSALFTKQNMRFRLVWAG